MATILSCVQLIKSFLLHTTNISARCPLPAHHPQVFGDPHVQIFNGSIVTCNAPTLVLLDNDHLLITALTAPAQSDDGNPGVSAWPLYHIGHAG